MKIVGLQLALKQMKKQYDFSKGEQGKFYRPDVVLKLPIYLDDDLVAFIEEYAKEKKPIYKQQ